MHHFTNFKNFAEAQIDLLKPLTILIGKNGSGKTNLIEGIDVFAHLAKGTPLHKFSDVGKKGKCEVRGGLGNCVGFDATDFEIHFDVESVGGLNYKIKIGRTVPHEYILLEESLFLSRILGDGVSDMENGVIDTPFFSAQRSGDVLKVKYNDFTGGKNPSISLAADRSVMSRYEEIVPGTATKDSEGQSIASLLNNISDCFKTAYIFDINPKKMRSYERIAAHTELHRDGRNLSAVLYALQKNGKLQELESITEIVRHLPEESFSEIGFIDTGAGDVMLGFYIGNNRNKRLLDARLLSDGTLRMLAVLTALETVPEGARIVVEEFDSGLHPSRVQRLIKHIYETAARRKLSILVTTHNPAVMNALTEEQMKSIVLCYHDKETGHSKLTPLMDIQDVDLMMLRGNLGDLVTDEIVEKYLSSEFRKERAEIARKWKERYFP